MRLFGNQIRRSVDTLRGSPEADVEVAAAFGGDAGADQVKVIMQVVVSLAMLAAGLYLLLAHWSSAAESKVGLAMVGPVVGYWLH